MLKATVSLSEALLGDSLLVDARLVSNRGVHLWRLYLLPTYTGQVDDQGCSMVTFCMASLLCVRFRLKVMFQKHNLMCVSSYLNFLCWLWPQLRGRTIYGQEIACAFVQHTRIHH